MKRIQFKAPTIDNLETKGHAHAVEVKSQDESGICHIKFYALAFNNVDSWGDIIMPGACDKWLKSEAADRMALCWQHNFSEVIGRITEKGVDDYGMWCKAEVLPTTTGKDAAILLKGGAIKEFSIGYRADKYHYETREGYPNDIRILDEITIYEASPVTIAANAKALLTDAKGGDFNNNQTKSIMTDQELKALKESLENAQESQAQMAQELKEYKDALAQAKSQAETLNGELKTAKEGLQKQAEQIKNLDETAKAQQKAIEEFKANLKKTDAPESYKSFITAFLEEHKEEIQKKMDQGAMRIKFETKSIVDITTALVTPNLSISLQKDTDISAAKRKKNTFLDHFGIAARTADKLSWLEGSAQDDVDYVDENGQNSHKGDATIGEKQRTYGKLQTSIFISTEVADWYPMLLDFAQNEAGAALLAKFNSEVWKGAGADTNATTQKKVYGIKGSSTAFAAIEPIDAPNVADVIFNACEQISNEGYEADTAFVSKSVYFLLRNLKNANGDYILDRKTNVLCNDAGKDVTVVKSHELTGKEIEVVDSSCCMPYAGNSFEFEAVRDADYDRWKFFFRLCGQNKIKTDWKKGLVYVADASVAITALTKPSAAAAQAEE